VLADDPILGAEITQYFGQPLFLVVANSVDAARRAAKLVRVEYEDLPALLTADDALAAGAFLLPSVTLQRGSPDEALAAAPHRLKGRLRIGGQEHFYLEGQVAYAIPREDGTMLVHSSTQHPADVQYRVARALKRAAKDITVECRRMGGAFGGKESQAALPGCAVAVAAVLTGRPVKLRLDRDDDFMITGKRHEFTIDYEVGFDGDGRIRGADLVLMSACGYSADLSRSVNDRAVLHADNCYFLEHVRIVSHRLKTHTQSATAFRGFGVPQGMLGAEQMVDEVARHLRLDPHEVRRRNLYGACGRDVTHYGQTLEDFIIPELISELEATAHYEARRRAITRWNETSSVIKRGIALVPIKFGIAYTGTFLNQGSAVVHVYEDDGSVLVNHGGTEMGQGLFTKVAQVVAEEFGIDVERVRASASDTSRIPNASATSASSGSDINGKAAQAAARKVRDRLSEFAATHFGVTPQEVVFGANQVTAGRHSLPFAEMVRLAYMARVQLWDSGFYSTPKIGYDRQALKGRPYLYYAYGVAVSEAAVDTLTGESKLLRVDILHDAGKSLNPAIDLGQVEGGFVQGLGWLTTEELCRDERGRLMTHSPSTYKVPVARDVPAAWYIKLFERGCNVEDTIHRSKGIGEPPLTLALSAFFAIKDAVAAAAGHCVSPRLNAPATPQEILSAVEDARRRL
jgi:xanthine dehydrogenase large subunit